MRFLGPNLVCFGDYHRPHIPLWWVQTDISVLYLVLRTYKFSIITHETYLLSFSMHGLFSTDYADATVSPFLTSFLESGSHQGTPSSDTCPLPPGLFQLCLLVIQKGFSSPAWNLVLRLLFHPAVGLSKHLLNKGWSLSTWESLLAATWEIGNFFHSVPVRTESDQLIPLIPTGRPTSALLSVQLLTGSLASGSPAPSAAATHFLFGLLTSGSFLSL